MNVLSKVRPEMFSTNKKLFLVEKIFSKHKTFSKICQSIFFNKFIFKKIIQFLKKTDANKKTLFPNSLQICVDFGIYTWYWRAWHLKNR